MIRPEADEVHISVAFTWNIEEAKRLQEAWSQYYPIVKIGGPALNDAGDGDFIPNRYIAGGYVYTSRGCNNKCPWCLVPSREGKIRLLPITEGHVIGDNNFLQTGKKHMAKVFQMLKKQSRANFAGGLQPSLVDGWFADQLKDIRIDMLFLAADTKNSLKSLDKAYSKLSFLPRRKLRCYMLLAFNGDTITEAEDRLERAWEIGVMPYAPLYQPPDEFIEYSQEWLTLSRNWSRPATMKAMHK